MLEAIAYIARSSGSEGMIGGQVIDIELKNENKVSYDLLRTMHAHKTGALIRAAVMAAAIICGCNKKTYDLLEKYADALGLAFQIKDDILDVEGEFKNLGKTTGKDMKNKKPTYVTLFGLNKAYKLMDEATEEAIFSLREAELKFDFLTDLVYYISKRNS